jgi:hypothetical protein
MSKEFWALFKILRELWFHKCLKFLIIIYIYSVPKLRSSMVYIINWVEIHVFFMPSKHCLPWSYIDIWSINSKNLLISKSLPSSIKCIYILTIELYLDYTNSMVFQRQKVTRKRLHRILEHCALKSSKTRVIV